ncbi:MAG: TVP38/TMEM64 family protein [Desulfobacterales bacterium]|uniref:TVP38/TMEM64 family membrane protein n=1 Tax=Candidatus Desulfaltia bathyphila TaxID=2841697 RepID=A0A8J6N755_9BACT|nr:TVP38/TMEM64 family protein [Candidatus Desulfaltia bathyphila]MBL7195312.1 TVP38/TMEM64 family protein [Desulfobacterales bacterium]MBL7207220.1 TVP38/TMEM64 family protein [Desulfobacterales bacterium]
MAIKSFSGKHIALILIILFSLALPAYFYRMQLWESITQWYNLFVDREKVTIFIKSFGWAAPVIFMIIQTLQVLFAPVPGEVSGFIGGYLFGATKGFLYSSMALTIGSLINFAIGRFLGKHYIRKLIPTVYLNKFDTILKRQGIFVSFILFVFPGFPKDYFCFFLGLSSIPAKIFIIIACIGRMPGTFMLSLQGASIYEQNYKLFAIVLGLSLVVALFAYMRRETLYQWVERSNNK